MTRDIIVQVTDDKVVYPQTILVNTKVIYYKDFNGRFWQFTPIKNPQIMMPFIITPLTEEQYNHYRELTK